MLAEEYPVRLLCKLLACAPSSYYYQPQGRDDAELRDLIEQIALEFPHYGYHRITAELRRRGHIVNHKRVLRIMREENLLVQVKRYVRTTFAGLSGQDGQPAGAGTASERHQGSGARGVQAFV